MPIPFQGEPINHFAAGLSQGQDLFKTIMGARLETEKQNLLAQQQARLQAMMPAEMAYKFGRGQESAVMGDYMSRLMNGQNSQYDNPEFSRNEQQNIPFTDNFTRQSGQVNLPERPGQEQSASFSEIPPLDQYQTNNSKQIAQNSQVMPEMNNQPEIINPGNPQFYFADNMAGKVKEVPPPHREFTDGYQVTTWPSGKVERIKVGPSAQEIAYDKGFGEYRAKTYADANDASMNYGSQQANFDAIVDTLNNHPHPEQLIGPVNKFLTELVGSPEDRNFIGKIMAAQGNIVLEAARNIKGAFTGRDQSLINSMKPNATDRFDVFLGKLQTLAELNKLSEKRMSVYAELIDKGVKPAEAIKEAQKQTDMSQIKGQYDDFVNFNQNKSLRNQGLPPKFDNENQAKKYYQFFGSQ